ncbi:MAG TPA: cellulase family glycosylhydrolase [Anaerolineaceae bacterium]|nr:cellulase family glycosylhydrolase [Anaerolineaceae bacterium]HPN50906.1 cellulase family glycosylhydrolase [Anaerolineaceae bacterium]
MTTIWMVVVIVLLQGCRVEKTGEQGGIMETPELAATDPGQLEIPFIAVPPRPPDPYTPPVTWAYRGAAVTGYWFDAYEQPEAFQMIDLLKDGGVNSIQLLVSWFQPDVRSSELSPEYDGQSPTDESVAVLVRYIHQKGMTVMLKLHAEPFIGWDGKEDAWRALIQPSDPEKWWQSYEGFVMHYAQLAEAEKMEMFCVGSEMASMTYGKTNQQRWKELAHKVKGIYSGKTLYHATWYEMFGGLYEDNGPDGKIAFSMNFEPLPASFWASFDYAGVGAYFDLYSPHVINLPDPGVETLYRGWFFNDTGDRPMEQADLFAAIEAWHKDIHNPVIFAEVGYENKDYTGYSNYEYDPIMINGQPVPARQNDMAQAHAYQATFEAWGGVPWLLGGYWWQFNPDWPTDANCGLVSPGAGDLGYSPCGRPAWDIVKEWYGAGK